MKTNLNMELKLEAAVVNGHIVPRTENNVYFKCSYKGAGKLISEKWNVKIYTSGSVVCNDEETLLDIINERLKQQNLDLKLIQIDDAGWGFPLCGVMVGVTDGVQVLTNTVPVSFFQGNKFKGKDYLKSYSSRGLELVAQFNSSPATHRIEICTGFINSTLKKALRKLKYDVRVTEIKGLLQDELEKLFKEHVKKEVGLDLAYDPKEMDKKKIGKAYYSVLNYGLQHTPHLLKSGWKSMSSK
jgi:hypothetical protein